MKTILVMTDFSKRSEHAAEVAMTIAEKTHAEILLFHAFYVPEVIPADSASYFYESNSTLEEQSLEKLQQFAKKLEKKQSVGYMANKVTIHLSQQPFSNGRDITRILTRKDIWLIVMGDKSREGAVSEFLFGSMATEVIDKAKCPVLLISQKVNLEKGFKIAFASNLETSHDSKALHHLAELATNFDSEIIIVHVCSESIPVEEMMNKQHYFEKLKARIGYPSISYEDLTGDNIPKTLEDYSRSKQVGMLAMVHNQYSFFKRLFHSSLTKKMMNVQKVPLMVLPQAR